MARLFLAVWPDPGVRARLAAARDVWTWPAGARPVPDERLHLTLHFIGSFRNDSICALQELLAAVPTGPMTLRAQRAELWRGGIAVLHVEASPALVSLHQALGTVLSTLRVPLDSRLFAPHVTLARRAMQARPPSGEDAAEIAWVARGFALVESIIGPKAAYRVLRSYAGAGRAG